MQPFLVENQVRRNYTSSNGFLIAILEFSSPIHSLKTLLIFSHIKSFFCQHPTHGTLKNGTLELSVVFCRVKLSFFAASTAYSLSKEPVKPKYGWPSPGICYVEQGSHPSLQKIQGMFPNKKLNLGKGSNKKKHRRLESKSSNSCSFETSHQ